MELKDWILLIVPILFNGIVVLIIQIIFEKKKIKRETKMPCYKNFSDLLKKCNNAFIDENINVQKSGKNVNESLKLFQNLIIEIIKYYDSNKLYLCKIECYCNALFNSWYNFEEFTKVVSNPLTNLNKKELGEKLQEVKDNLNKLNEVLDDLILKI